MKSTPYQNINKLLEILLSQIQNILGNKLVGLYLEGSFVLGDFDSNISDIDLVATLASDIDDKEFEELQKMHADFVKEHKEWDDRIEVCYITVEALKKVKSQTSMIINISPGEPFHRVESSKEWVMNWYLTREKSKTLFGPDPKTIIEPISKEEFIESVKDHTKSWDKWVKNMHSKKAQAYAILTLCRAFYAVKNGEQISKEQAAEWVKKELPLWSKLIDMALEWRKEKGRDIEDKETFGETVKFVNFVRKLILK